MSEAGRWQTIEHTGDLAITVEAPSFEYLFATAAAALAGVLLGEESGAWEATTGSRSADSQRELSVESADEEALLVDWLRELLYIQMTEEAVVAAVQVGELTEKRVEATVMLRSLSSGKNMERELKAVTYHDAEVGRRGDGWFARIVFDV